jgi:Spy/CpxP family protein refolding chaperone
MKTSKWLTIAMAAAISVGGVTVWAIQAAQPAAPFSERRAALRSRAIERLGLTDEQAAKIKAELRGEKVAITSLLERLHNAHEQLRNTIQQEGVTEEAVRAASAKVASVQADIAVERAKLHRKIRPLLTTDQLARVREMQERLDGFLDRVVETIGERLAGE